MSDNTSPGPTRLVVATEAHFDWAIRGSSVERSLDGLRLCAGGIESAPVLRWIASSSRAVSAVTGAPAAWLIVSRDEAVGVISYKSAPIAHPRTTNSRAVVVDAPITGARRANGSESRSSDVLVEIGYGVAETARGHGHATRAITALAAIARAQGLGLYAETSAHNRASHVVLERNGFERTIERVDPDEGALWGWVRRCG